MLYAYICFLTLDCTDLWRKFVLNKRPVKIALTKKFQAFYTNDDLSALLKYAITGEIYTMVLRVSSTCPNDVTIGFSGRNGSFKVEVPANSKNERIAVTDTWDGIKSTRLENRMTCGLNNVTIHHVRLIKATEDCLDNDG